MIVSFEDVHFTYPSGVEAVRGVSLTVPYGQRLAIIGQNGAGKTTLVRHLNGIFTPTSGTVRIGEQVTRDKDISELARYVGYVFQNPDEQLFARSVRDDVAFGPTNLGFDEATRERLIADALELTGIADKADSHPYHLSLSERKRVALASVLAMDTPVVVLDEPTTGQDARGVELIAQIVTQLHEAGKTVIAITHDMDFCAENFERVVVMTLGEVCADGTPEEVFRQADALAAAQVEPPQLARLALELGWDTLPMNVEDFAAGYTARTP